MADENLLALLMIVKDEDHAVEATLDSVGDVVDRFVVVDTGSSDRTRDVVQAWRSHGRCSDLPTGPGGGRPASHLLERPFDDFASARNDVADRHAALPDPSRWTVAMSADETLAGGDRLREFLSQYDGDETALLVEVRTEDEVCAFPRVLRAGGPWRWEGAVQERPVNRLEGRDPQVRVPGVMVVHKATDSKRRLARVAERDVPLLSAVVADRSADKASRNRAAVMLAQAHEMVAAATQGDDYLRRMTLAMGLYMQRMADGGDSDEVAYAAAHFLNVCETLGIYDDEEMLKANRLGALEQTKIPEVHLMIASHVARLDAKTGLERARAAAAVAKAALDEPGRWPVSRSALWASHLVAAHCAKVLGDAESAKQSAAEGIRCGGPRERFAEFLQEAR